MTTYGDTVRQGFDVVDTVNQYVMDEISASDISTKDNILYLIQHSSRANIIARNFLIASEVITTTDHARKQNLELNSRMDKDHDQ